MFIILSYDIVSRHPKKALKIKLQHRLSMTVNASMSITKGANPFSGYTY